MIWFMLSARGLQLVIVAVLLAVLTAALDDVSLVTPVIGPGSPFDDLPLAAVIPLLLTTAIGAAHDWALPPAAAALARSLSRMLTGLGIAVAAIYVAAHALIATAFGNGWWDATRNLCGYLALLLIGQRLLSLRLATMVPAICLVVGAIFGRAPSGASQPWAWPMTSASLPELLVAISTLTVIAAAALILPPAGRSRSDSRLGRR